MLGILPVELLAQIISYLPDIASVHNLQLTSRTLNEAVEKEGWRSFVQARWPHVSTPPCWREAAHGLSTLSRNWERRAIMARFADPTGSIISFPEGQRKTVWERPWGQTMGYKPMIDSCERWTGGRWADRREVLAYSAGAELVLRAKRMGDEALKQWRLTRQEDKPIYFNHHRQNVGWVTYRPHNAREGRDDITSVKLLRPEQVPGSYPRVGFEEDVLYGTASGDLCLTRFSPNHTSTIGTFSTDSLDVKSLDVTSSVHPLLAACLDSSKLALYSLDSVSPDTESQSVSTIDTVARGDYTTQVWSTRFLSNTRLAVGLGPTQKPLRIYDVTPSGLGEHPVRAFGFDGSHYGGTTNATATVYPISPLPSSTLGGSDSGDIFLSGFFDSSVRLHDMRSPRDHEVIFMDPLTDSPVYSIQPLAGSRFLAGSAAQSILKVFDLRTAGMSKFAKIEQSLDANHPEGPLADILSDDWDTRPKSWNVFLHPQNFVNIHGRQQRRRGRESALYSLSSPSPASPSFFVGLENNVMQVDLVSMLDSHPDPVFANTIVRRGKYQMMDVKNTWDPPERKGEGGFGVLNLASVDHGFEMQGSLRLRTQSKIGKYKGTISGMDDRWIDNAD